MENFQPPSIPSTTTMTSSTPQETQLQFSTCEPMTSFPSTIGTPGADLYSYYPAQYLAPNPGLQFQHGYDYNPYQQASQPMTPFLVDDQQNIVLSTELDSLESERKRLGDLMCKAARNERRMALARQRSISLSRKNANAAVSSRRHAPFYGCNDDGGMSPSPSGAGADLQNTKKHLYPFCTIDNKKLRVLFKKELKKTDVGSLGRIVLPKKEAEENLPVLFNKEGIHLVIRDVHSDQEWGLKYKYWSNNKSRMYVLENTGSFVRQKELQAGDCIYLYEDECKNLYISAEKIARPAQVAEPSSSQQLTTTANPINQNMHNSNSSSCNPPNLKVLSTELNTTTTTTYTNTNHSDITEANITKTNENISAQYTYEARDEEDTSSLARLMEQLQQEQEANRQLLLSMKSSSSSHITTNEEAITSTTTSSYNFTSYFETFTQPSTLARIGPLSSSSTSSSSLLSTTRILKTDDDPVDDCYKGLGTLPEVDRYKYSHYLFDDNRDDDKP